MRHPYSHNLLNITAMSIVVRGPFHRPRNKYVVLAVEIFRVCSLAAQLLLVCSLRSIKSTQKDWYLVLRTPPFCTPKDIDSFLKASNRVTQLFECHLKLQKLAKNQNLMKRCLQLFFILTFAL